MLLQYESTVKCSNFNEILNRNSQTIHPTNRWAERITTDNILDLSLFEWSAIIFGTQHNMATEWREMEEENNNNYVIRTI